MKKIGVLVVTYNQYRVTLNFINKFLNLFKEEYIHLLILDNNSKDETYGKLSLKFPDLDIRKLNDNYGCVTGRNVGIVELMNQGCEYLLLLDNDIVIEDQDFFYKMCTFIESQDKIDGCCPVVRRGDTRDIQTLGRRLTKFRRNITDIASVNKIDILPGCAAFIKAETFKKIGLYDNDLSPISIEDYEWGIRAKKKKAKFFNNPDVEVFHYFDRKKKVKDLVAFGIVGRMIFLRKYFSLFNLIREIIFALRLVLRYGVLFVLINYIKGLLKKIHKDNFDYTKFSSQDIKKYYVNY